MIRGKTTSGFEYELEEELLDDYELLESLCEIDEGNGEEIVAVVKKLLGEEQKNRLKEHIRTEKGRVSAQRLFEEVSEILKSNDTGKN